MMLYCGAAFLHVCCQGMSHILYESDSFLVIGKLGGVPPRTIANTRVMKHRLSINSVLGVVRNSVKQLCYT